MGPSYIYIQQHKDICTEYICVIVINKLCRIIYAQKHSFFNEIMIWF